MEKIYVVTKAECEFEQCPKYLEIAFRSKEKAEKYVEDKNREYEAMKSEYDKLLEEGFDYLYYDNRVFENYLLRQSPKLYKIYISDRDMNDDELERMGL